MRHANVVLCLRCYFEAGHMADQDHIAISGLATSGSITVDRWGIAHIKAQNARDLFTLQGFNAARDRLWQLDLWRKRGLGLLARDFGPGFLEQDKASRLFLFRGDMQAEWAAYGDDAQDICTAFVTGINAYIALTEAEPARLPPEFGLMHTRPERWQPHDVVRIRSHGLTRNALSEVLRSLVLARADVATDALRKMIEPAKVPVVPPGIALGAVPLEALDMFKLASAHVTFEPERMACTLGNAAAWRKTTELGDVLRDLEFQGSNNWAVSGAITNTGKPILSSDPHRAHGMPSLRYLVHLTCPEFDLIGAGEPCIPGISLGHNGEAAFGLTIFGADQEDVYVYETLPDNPHAYRNGTGVEAMRLVDEVFAVKGHPDQHAQLAFTCHGPVIWRDAAVGIAVAVRSVWFEPGGAPYMASLRLMRAKSLGEFRAGAAFWGAPSVNLVYADQSGTIAWMPAGYTPIRPNWDGLLPVPGDGSHEWAGLMSHAEMPVIINPPQGFVYSANEMNLPADWPHNKKPVGFEWTENSRASRIREALSTTPLHTVATACALQTDVLSMPARLLRELVMQLPAEGAVQLAQELFGPWNARLEAHSAAASLFEMWWTKDLRTAVLEALCIDLDTRALLAPGDPASFLDVLEQPDGRWGAEPYKARDALLVESLSSAVQRCRDAMGEPSHWAWGRLHKAVFNHPLGAIHPAVSSWSAGPFPMGGSASTPMHTGYRPADFRVTNGASFRMVVDLANLDASRCINAPGQSGDPASPHFADLASIWAAGAYVPMCYSAQAVAGHALQHITLAPA